MTNKEYEPTEEDFNRGYWYHRRDHDFPPPAIFNIDTSFAESRLCLAGVPGSPQLSDYQYRKIIKGWAKIVPKLQNVEMLWVAPKVNQELFNAICCMPRLKGLWLKHTSIKNMESSALKGLKFLHLGSSPSLSSIKQLSNIKTLNWLDTENLKRISDFSLISNLRNLVGLGINGSMWTTQRIDSLAPLSKLTKLRYLSLVNTRAIDKSLVPLYSLGNLQTLQMAEWWPRAEVEELKRVNPRLRGI